MITAQNENSSKSSDSPLSLSLSLSLSYTLNRPSSFNKPGWLKKGMAGKDSVNGHAAEMRAERQRKHSSRRTHSSTLAAAMGTAERRWKWPLSVNPKLRSGAKLKSGAKRSGASHFHCLFFWSATQPCIPLLLLSLSLAHTHTLPPYTPTYYYYSLSPSRTHKLSLPRMCLMFKCPC